MFILKGLFFVALLFIVSTDSTLCAQSKDTLTYAFFGHIYQWGSGGNKVDSRIEKMDLNRFDRIWLGGDLCSEASLDYSTITYLDSLFDLSKPENHWALGNHDTRNGNIEWITDATERPTYYAYSKNGITTIVMNGNISPLDCENLNEQYKIIKNVCDTISKGYLIFLSHHGLFSNVPGIPNPSQFGHSYLKNWMANCDADSADYINTIYPLLIDVKKKGVEVIHIMGDVGANKKSFEGKSDDGIVYLGSGINNSFNFSRGIPIKSPDLVLIFKHVVSENKLMWSFEELNDL